jgi:lipopolysaccharide biosynthesis protein
MPNGVRLIAFMSRTPGYPVHPCVFVGWDSTPRRGRHAIVIANNTPELFRERLEAAVAAVTDRSAPEKLVFVNAWNEWAEGNYLEPDATYGHAFLQELARVSAFTERVPVQTRAAAGVG